MSSRGRRRDRDVVSELLANYGIVDDAMLDEEEALLYAIALELRADRISPFASDIEVALQEDRDVPTTKATYHSREYSLDEQQNTDDWEIEDFDFLTREIDLRFDDDIIIAFDLPSTEENRIEYAAGDSPVTGIPATTTKIYAVAQNGTGGASLTVDAWSRGLF